MTSEHDALRALAESDPARSAAAFDPASAKGRELLARAKSVPPRRRMRRPRLLVIVAVGTAAAAAAAAAFVNTRQPDRVLSVGCYNSTERQIGFVVNTEDATAVDACWKVWRAGKFSPTPTPPRLVPCVVNGIVHVYPGGPETCAKLGAPLAPDDVGATRQLVRLSDSLAELMPGFRCTPPGEARELARTALDRAGLKDWDVVDRGGYDEARPCVEPDIDEANDAVVLLPAPRPS